MEEKYQLFDFQQVLEEIVSRSSNDDNKDLIEYICSIPKNMSIEELPLYKDFLSKFDVEHAFESIELQTDLDLGTKDDYNLLQRLVYASFSSTYDFIYDEKDNKIRLLISVNSGTQHITKYLDELWSFQLISLYRIYLNEQLELESLAFINEDDVKELNEQRKVKLLVFEKKIKQIKSKLKCRQDGLNIISDLDDLLNS